MARVLFRHKVHGRMVEVGCYGAGKDWVARLTDPSSQEGGHNDAYSPPPDLGFVWLRESDKMWLASGLFNRAVFKDVETVDELLYQVMREVVGTNDQLASCVELVAAEFTGTFDGENGPLQGAGGWAETRWWQ